MSKVLFMNFPAYGHVNPTLGLAHELVARGEQVDYTCADSFREKIEQTGAIFKNYGRLVEQNISFQKINANLENMIQFLKSICESSLDTVEKMIEDIGDTRYDYIIKDSLYPFATIVADILKVPSVSSCAVYATYKDMQEFDNCVDYHDLLSSEELKNAFEKTKEQFAKRFDIELPDLSNLFYTRTDLNIAYTSHYFVPHKEYYDDSFVFIGPPIYDRHESIEFPFEKLRGRKVVYISMGTVFSENTKLYELFFKAFENTDYLVVMSAYKVDLSQFTIPENFIVRNFVPQSEILKYTAAAITHGGMNSISDLMYNEVPFVAIPIGADQPCNSYRASSLGASITLDVKKLTPELIRNSINDVISNGSFLKEIKKISDSFKNSGGYKKGADEIFKLKKRLNIG